MDNPTRLTLERPAAGKVDMTLHIPALPEVVASFGLAPDQSASKIIADLFTLTAVGRIELAGRDAAIIVMVFKWLSSKLPRTKFSLRAEADDGTRAAYDFQKGAVTERDPAKPKPKPKAASKELELTLQKAAAVPYSARTRYAVGDVVEHPSFGRGLVAKIVDQKIVVQFVDTERTLVHARA